MSDIFVLHCTGIRASNLKNVEWIGYGKNDPFVRLRFGNFEKKTSVKDNAGAEATWDEVIDIVLSDCFQAVHFNVLQSWDVSVDVFDWNCSPRPQKLIGSAVFNAKDLLSRDTGLTQTLDLTLRNGSESSGKLYLDVQLIKLAKSNDSQKVTKVTVSIADDVQPPFVVELAKDASVTDLKTVIEEAIGIPRDNQQLLFNRLPLVDGKALTEYMWEKVGANYSITLEVLRNPLILPSTNLIDMSTGYLALTNRETPRFVADEIGVTRLNNGVRRYDSVNFLGKVFENLDTLHTRSTDIYSPLFEFQSPPKFVALGMFHSYCCVYYLSIYIIVSSTGH